MSENDPHFAQPRQGMDYGENEDVHQVHAAIQREKREPRVGLEPLSMWLIVVYGLAVFFGGAYLGRFSGNFTGEALDPPVHPARVLPPGATPPPGGGGELTPVERGKKVFLANCAVCHQTNGLGSAAQGYPPLAGSEYTNGGSRRNAMIVLKGLQGPITVNGQQFGGTAVMQAWDKTLNDQKIADVLTYVRQEWGNKGTPVSQQQVATLRKELASHAESYTEADLKAVKADEDIPGGEAAPPAGGKPGEPPKPAASPAAPAAPQPKA